MMIRSLQRSIGYEAASRNLGTSGLQGIVRRCLSGPARAIAEIYIPYRLYKVTLEDRRLKSIPLYAVDAATGTLDPYEFTAPPGPDAFMEVETRNAHPVRLEEDLTKKIVTEKVRRLLYSRGFFRLANPTFTAEMVQGVFHIPYWAGFYGGEQNIKVTVLNAVRQTMEGSKVRQLVKTWLLEADRHTNIGVPPVENKRDICIVNQ